MEQTRHSQSISPTILSSAEHFFHTPADPIACVVLLGPPGCGKGTQGRLISESLGIPLISSGEILRTNVRQRTMLGLQAQKSMESGALVSDEIILQMLRWRVLESDCTRGFVLDGVPRSTRQAEFLETELFGSDRRQIPFVVVKLEMDDQSLIKRITGRRVCLLCGATYNLETNPPLMRGKCDSDLSDLVQRSDDSVEVFRKRLNEYRATSSRILSYLSLRHGEIPEIACNRPIEHITSELLEVIRGSIEKPVLEAEVL